MPNPMNCETCDYKALNKGDPGHCYMFRDPPEDICRKHTGFTKSTEEIIAELKASDMF